jgi:organic radical activating enzyme
VKDLRSPGFLAQPQALSVEALRGAATKLDEYGITEIEITGGGEPMLHPDIQQIVDITGGDRKVKLYTNGMKLRPITGIDEINVSRCHWNTTVNNEIYRARRPTDLTDVLEYYRPLVGTIRMQILLLRGYVDSPERMLEFVERHSDLVDTFMFRTLFSRSDRIRELYAEVTLDHPKVKMDTTSDTYTDCWSINTAGVWTRGMPW